MYQIDEIVLRLKKYVQKDCGTIFDKDVADMIKIGQHSLRTHINRKSIPYKHICLWCFKNNVSINSILYGQDLENEKPM